MLNLSRLSKYLFCSIDRFKCSEAVFKTLFAQNQKYKNVNKSLSQSKSQAELQSYMLSDKINMTLQQLARSGSVKQSVAEQFIQMFRPTGGIRVSQNAPSRVTAGINSQELFPLNLKSAMSKAFLSQLFCQSQLGYIEKGSSVKILFLKGTTGLGKSCFAYAAKTLMDFRVRHVIKHGCPSETIFGQNIKFFYFIAGESKWQTMARIKIQLKNDFGQSGSELMNLGPDQLDQFLGAVGKIYSKKKIAIIPIIDQLNFLFSFPQNQETKKRQLEKRENQVQKWNRVMDYLDSPMAVLMSSKNVLRSNVNDKDPLYKLLGNQQLRKQVIADQFLSAENRLQYAAQSLIFKLQKNGLRRNKAIEIVKELNQIPFLTHKTARNLMNKVFSSQKANQKLNNRQIASSIKNSIENQGDSIKNIVKNLQEQLKNQVFFKSVDQIAKNEDTKARTFNSKAFLLTPSTTNVQTTLVVKDENQNDCYLKLNFNAITRKVRQKFAFEELEFSSLFPYAAEKIRSSISLHYDSQIMEYLKKTDMKSAIAQAQILPSKFENNMCAHIQKNSGNVTIRFQEVNYQKTFQNVTCLNKKIILNESNDEKVKTIEQNFAQKLVPINNQKIYIRTMDSAQTCDFILTRRGVDSQSTKLTIFLCDATLAWKVDYKYNKFYQQFIKENKVFRKLIKQMHKNETIHEIQIVYYVIQPHIQFFEKHFSILHKKTQAQVRAQFQKLDKSSQQYQKQLNELKLLTDIIPESEILEIVDMFMKQNHKIKKISHKKGNISKNIFIKKDTGSGQFFTRETAKLLDICQAIQIEQKLYPYDQNK